MKTVIYSFSGELWRHRGSGGWFFVTLPTSLSKKIRKGHAFGELGWGRLPANARIGEIEWSTAIWFDTKRDTYLLPVKASVRQKERLTLGQDISVQLIVKQNGLNAFKV